jgi:hypothetical protein
MNEATLRADARHAARVRTVQNEVLVGLVGRRARPGERAEDVLLDLGIVSEPELAVQLALSAGFPFEGLRGFIPDPRLFLYVPLATALSERICPLVLVGDSLKLASAYLDPDLLAIEMRFPSLEIEIVVSPRSELLEALRFVAADS